MIYEYACHTCEVVFEQDFRMGKAPPTVPCPHCGVQSGRHYGAMTFLLKGGGWPSKKATFNQEMTNRNKTAAGRMCKEHGKPGLRLAALDYGNGDVREVK